jgi:amicyanin
MNKTVVTIIIVIVALGAAVGIVATNKRSSKQPVTDTTTTTQTMESHGTPTTKQESTEVTSTDKVVIVDSAFSPKTIKVKKGTTVTWTNQDSIAHDVKPDKDYGDAFVGSNDLLEKGESYSFTFNTTGTYDYHCTPHPFMKASVEVVAE